MSAPVDTRPVPTVEPPAQRAWRWWMAVIAIVVLVAGILVGRAWTGGSEGEGLDPIAPVEPTEEPAEEPAAETPPAEEPAAETPPAEEPAAETPPAEAPQAPGTDEPTDGAEPDPAREDVGAGLPMEARLTAQEVFTFADRGDLDSLARLALDGEMPFTASFGEEFTTPAQLVAYWERIGADEVTGAIRALVLLPDWYVTTGSGASGADLDIHVTPRFMHEPTAANRAALESAIGRDAVEAGIADGQWLGWRMGISADGDWRFFVRGD